MDVSSRKSKDLFKQIKTGLTINITKIEGELNTKFEGIQTQIQQSIRNSKTKLQNYIRDTIKNELGQFQQSIIKHLNNTITKVQSQLKECHTNINKLEKATTEIQDKLEKVDTRKLEQILDGDKKYFLKWYIIPYFEPDPNYFEFEQELNKIKKDKGTIVSSIGFIKKNLNLIQSIITSIKEQIKELSRQPVTGGIDKYEKFVKDYLSIESKLTEITSRLEAQIEQLKSSLPELDKKIDPLIKQYANLRGSRSFKSHILYQILIVTKNLIVYKKTKKKKDIIQRNHEYLKDFKTSQQPKINNINTYITIHKQVESLKKELEKSESNIDNLEPDLIKPHFETIKTNESLLDQRDPVKKQSQTILEYQTQLSEMEKLNKTLNNIKTNVRGLSFNKKAKDFNLNELVKDSQEITSNMSKYDEMGNVKSDLLAIQSGIENLKTISEILTYKDSINSKIQSSMNDFETELDKLNKPIDEIIPNLDLIKSYLNRIICIKSCLTRIQDIKSNIETLRKYMGYIGEYKKLVCEEITKNNSAIHGIVPKLTEYEQNLEAINEAITNIKTKGSDLKITEVTGLSGITSTIAKLKTKISTLKEVNEKIGGLQKTLSSITSNIKILESKILQLELSIESVVKEFLKCSNNFVTCNLHELFALK